MSIDREHVAWKVGEYTTLGRTGICTATGSATTLTDAARLASYAFDVPEGSIVYLEFTKTATTISFDDTDASYGNSILDSGNGLAAYRVGDVVRVSGTTLNDDDYTITAVNQAGLTVTETVVDESAGSSFTLTTKERNSVSDFDKTVGTVTFVPGGNTSAAGHTYEMWEPCVELRERVNEAISRALTEDCFYIKRLPLGMLADGDCQAVTGWSVTSSATRAVAALAFPYWFDRYYLAVTSSDGSDYVYQDVLAEEDSIWHIAVLMRTAADTTGSIELYDNPGTATITPTGDTLSVTGETSSGSGWQLLKAQFTVPTDCDSFRVKLLNDTASGVTHFAFVASWPANTRSLPVPTGITNIDDVWRILRLREKLSKDYPFTPELTPYTHAWPARAYGGLAVEFDTVVGSMGPFFAEIKAHYAALTDDDAGDTTSDTDCPDDYVSYMAAKQLALAIARRQRLINGIEDAAPYEALAMEMLHKAGKAERAVVGGVPTIVRNRRA